MDNFYLKKYAFCQARLDDAVDPSTELIVVIPCHNEPNLINTLSSLDRCTVPDGIKVEVIVSINASEKDEEYIIQRNHQTVIELGEWIKASTNPSIKYYYIENNNLPQKHAGVGLGRKIGMDEAVSRFHQISKDGIIVMFDADSTCKTNYLEEIFKHFKIILLHLDVQSILNIQLLVMNIPK